MNNSYVLVINQTEGDMGRFTRSRRYEIMALDEFVELSTYYKYMDDDAHEQISMFTNGYPEIRILYQHDYRTQGLLIVKHLPELTDWKYDIYIQFDNQKIKLSDGIRFDEAVQLYCSDTYDPIEHQYLDGVFSVDIFSDKLKYKWLRGAQSKEPFVISKTRFFCRYSKYNNHDFDIMVEIATKPE